MTDHKQKGALVGNPVEHSIGDITHNQIFALSKVKACYEKINLSIDHFESEMQSLKALNYRYFAVTMPFKERMIALLDDIDPDAKYIGSVNTVIQEKGRWIGFNTDGKGALSPIKDRRRIAGLKVLVLGAGGAARAIIYELVREGAFVDIFNRTYEKAQKVADRLGAKVVTQVKREYDLIINTTGVGMMGGDEKKLVDFDYLKGKPLLYDIVYTPTKTPFLNEGLQRGYDVIYGKEMFGELSYLQFLLAFGPCIDRKLVLQIVDQTIEERGY